MLGGKHSATLLSLNITATLIWRHTQKLRNDFFNLMVDALIFMGLQVLEFAYFIPALTHSTNTIAATAVGSILLLLISSGYKTMYPIAHEIEHGGTLRYFLSLPIAPSWIFISYIAAFALEFFSFGAPTIAGALWVQREHLTLTAASLAYGFTFLCLCLVFFGTLFLTIVLNVSSQWYRSNTWARILGPLAAIGPTFVQWTNIYKRSKLLGYILLCNPFTYVTEGFRSALLQLPGAIPAWLCTTVLLMLIFGLSRLLFYGIEKKMDPVLL